MEHVKQIGMMTLSILLALVIFDMVIKPMTKGMVAQGGSKQLDPSKSQKS